MILTSTQISTLKTHGFSLPEDNKYFLDDGTYSSVIKVKVKVKAADEDTTLNDQFYAIKIVDKHLLIKHDKSNSILAEKRNQLPLTHLNVIKLYLTFQDQQSLCI